MESSRRQIDAMMSPKINRNTNALVLRKIQGELAELLGDEEELNPLIALSVLEEVFNVDLNPNKSAQNGQLVQRVVGLLGEREGQGCGAIRADRLREFISIVVVGHAEGGAHFGAEEARGIA